MLVEDCRALLRRARNDVGSKVVSGTSCVGLAMTLEVWIVSGTSCVGLAMTLEVRIVSGTSCVGLAMTLEVRLFQAPPASGSQ